MSIRAFAGQETFVDHLVYLYAVLPAARAALYGAINVFSRHVVLPRFVDCEPELEVGVGIATAFLGGDRNGARELGKYFRALGVIDTFSMLDARPV